jgi:hypothetical protein
MFKQFFLLQVPTESHNRMVFNVDWVLGWVHCVDMGDAAYISEVHPASIFRFLCV